MRINEEKKYKKIKPIVIVFVLIGVVLATIMGVFFNNLAIHKKMANTYKIIPQIEETCELIQKNEEGFLGNDLIIIILYDNAADTIYYIKQFLSKCNGITPGNDYKEYEHNYTSIYQGLYKVANWDLSKLKAEQIKTVKILVEAAKHGLKELKEIGKQDNIKTLSSKYADLQDYLHMQFYDYQDMREKYNKVFHEKTNNSSSANTKSKSNYYSKSDSTSSGNRSDYNFDFDDYDDDFYDDIEREEFWDDYYDHEDAGDFDDWY